MSQIFAVEFPSDHEVKFTVHEASVTLSRTDAEVIARRILKDELYPMPERVATVRWYPSDDAPSAPDRA